MARTAAQNEARRASYEAAKVAGVCPRCGAPARETVLCVRHALKQQAAQRRYERRKRGG